MDLIVILPSSHAALAAEQELRAAGVPVELIPVPRQIRSDCGFCLLAQAGEPGTSEADGRLRAVRACGAQALWRVVEQPGVGPRKVKSYEPYD